MITYKFVKNDKGELINIAEINDANRKNTYLCIECNSVMLPVLGKIKEHHFRHKCEGVCNRESYLHKLGKMAFKKRFETSNKFIITYRAKEECSINCKIYNQEQKQNNCPSRRMLQTFDLKELYDTCEEESVYNGYKADLKLSNSKEPALVPTFLEIVVTHECTDEKINSGIWIIEIKIEDEEDVNLQIDETLFPKITYYNFPLDRISPVIEKKFYALSIYKDLSCNIEQIGCYNFDDQNTGNYLVKFILNNEPNTLQQKRSLYYYGIYYIYHNNPIKCCIFCYRYYHNNCVKKEPYQYRLNRFTNTYQTRYQRISIRQWQGDYLESARNCNRFLIDRRNYIAQPTNIIKVLT